MFSKKIMCDKNYELLTWVIHAVFISHESCLFCLNKGAESHIIFVVLMKNKYPLHMH